MISLPLICRTAKPSPTIRYDEILCTFFTLSAKACALIKALEKNTNMQEIHLASIRATNLLAKACANMLRVNSTLRVLDLEVSCPLARCPREHLVSAGQQN
jgi:hypothetical protein